jgi:tRNA threonylcarbamoyladenosine biosynthesis protein TsaE
MINIMTKTSRIEGLEAMSAFARDFKKTFLSNQKKDKATVVTLKGDLGSGKTTFVRLLAHELGVSSRVTSPTFVIEKRHKIPSGKSSFKSLVHIDAYRLEGVGENIGIDFEDIFADFNNLICVEWPEYISSVLPLPDISLEFEFIDEDTRKITQKTTQRGK